MTFDPFNDFDSRGYLRNFHGEKDLLEVKVLEHHAFLTNLKAALDYLDKLQAITYAAFKQTHRTLFSSVYPWAGEDRATTAPNIAITKGGHSNLFARPMEIERAAEYELRRGNNASFMRNRPGEVFAGLAYAHPFLDGNGRTIITVHTVLADKAGFSIDWQSIEKEGFLQALTQDLEHPGVGTLDGYLKPYSRARTAPDQRLADLLTLRGLGTVLASEKTSNPTRE